MSNLRYKALAEQIVEDIRNEKWSQGEKLPSLRQLTDLFGVSMTTAQNCYHHLEELGWLIVKPQSGFYANTPIGGGSEPSQPQFVSRVSTKSQSPQWSEGANSSSIREFGYQSSPFGISRISPALVDVKILQRAIKRALQRLDRVMTEYPDPQGWSPLRQALSNHFNQYGFALPAQETVITGGCIEAVRLALEVTTKPGDAIAISSPCFSGLIELLASLSRRTFEIPCTKEGVDLDQLERQIAKGGIKAVLLSTSHMNPQGTSLTPEQNQKLAWIVNYYQVPMIEDDVYLELGHNSSIPKPAKTWDTDGYILWCGSISKSLAAGYRLGWCWPGRYIAEYLTRYNAGGLGHSLVLQAGLAEYINTGQYQKHIEKARAKLFSNVCGYRSLLLKKLPKNSAVSQPKGGAVLWVEVPSLNANKFYDLTRQAGLDVRTGDVFTTLSLYREFFRINAGWGLDEAFDDNRSVREALDNLCQIAHKATE